MVRQRSVAVVVDSSACLPREVLERYGIIVVPHEVVIEGTAYRDLIDIDARQFYRMIKNGLRPTTSAPRPLQFLEAYREASRLAPNVLCLSLSPNFSSAYNSALVARKMAEEALPQVHIEVVDTEAAAGAEGLIVLEAARLAEQGARMDEVLARVRDLIPRVDLLAFLDSLTYLARGGRVPRVAAWATSLLDIKPVAEMRRGLAHLVERPRSRPRAMARLLELVRHRVGDRPVHLIVMHADAPEDAEKLARELHRNLNVRELLVSEFTPVMGAHTGPGLLAVAFYTDE